MYYPVIGHADPGELIQDISSGDGEDGEEWLDEGSGETDQWIDEDLSELGAEDGVPVVKDFRLCLYLDQENPPAPIDEDIVIFRQPAIQYYVL